MNTHQPELPTIRPLPALRRVSDALARVVTGAKQVENPMTGKAMNAEEAQYVTDLKTVRRNARPAARSGNPAKREPARKVVAAVGPMIHQTYVQDAVKTYRREVGA